MKLDPRIYADKKPLDCFDIQKAKKFLGVKGYFSPCIEDFSDLSLTDYGELVDIDDRSTMPYGINLETYYGFFLPETWVRKTIEDLTEAKHEAEVQGSWLFEEIKDRANEYSLDLDWYAKEVMKQIKRYVDEELGE